jgi:Leucine-rich repeat (LRR) protein
MTTSETVPSRGYGSSHPQRIPADVVQNTAEYVGPAPSLLACHGVSTLWQSAVCDAVGFLNGRCWTALVVGPKNSWPYEDVTTSLGMSLRCDDSATVSRCAAVCLWSRLEALTWSETQARGTATGLSLEWLFRRGHAFLSKLELDRVQITTDVLTGYRGLTVLRLRGDYLKPTDLEVIARLPVLEVLDLSQQPLSDLGGLRGGCVALKELTLCGTLVTDDSFLGLGAMLGRLVRLDVGECRYLTTISNLAHHCTTLRVLRMVKTTSGSSSLAGLEEVTTLAEIEITGPFLIDVTLLRNWTRTVVLLNLKGTFVSDVSCLRHSSVLRELWLTGTFVDDNGICGLDEIPTLELLDLGNTRVCTTSTLADSPALRDLNLGFAPLRDISGLERIATLTKLTLISCSDITPLSTLSQCGALCELNLDFVRGLATIAGLETTPTLTKLSLRGYIGNQSVSALGASRSLRELNLSNSGVTAMDLAGLKQFESLTWLDASSCHNISTAAAMNYCRSLRHLNLAFCGIGADGIAELMDSHQQLQTLELFGCSKLDHVGALGRSMSLRELNISSTSVTNAGIFGLECIPTLTSLSLAWCHGITDVTGLSASRSLRLLNLSYTGVTNEGIAGIERWRNIEFVAVKGCQLLSNVAALIERASRNGVRVTIESELHH